MKILLLHSYILAHTVEITGGVAGGIILTMLIISLILYRNWRYEQELDSLLWKIDFRDIEINEEPNSNVVGGKVPRVSRTYYYYCTTLV